MACRPAAAFDAVVLPDVVVPGAGYGNPPRLVVEVSAQTSRVDGLEKALLYARAGIGEYWQIDLAWRLVYTHLSPHGEGYGRRVRAGGVFSELGDFQHLTTEAIFAVTDAA